MTNELDDGLIVVERQEDIPKFASEAEEAAFWSTHALGNRLFTHRGPRPGGLVEKLSKLRFQPRAVYDRDADAVYVYLYWGRSGKTKKLDRSRLLDFGDDGRLIGVQFLKASKGIHLRGVPDPERVADLLKDLDLHILA